MAVKSSLSVRLMLCLLPAKLTRMDQLLPLQLDSGMVLYGFDQDLCDRMMLSANDNLRASALLALCKLMALDATFCDSNLQLIFTLLQNR